MPGVIHQWTRKSHIFAIGTEKRHDIRTRPFQKSHGACFKLGVLSQTPVISLSTDGFFEVVFPTLYGSETTCSDVPADGARREYATAPRRP